MAFSGLHVACCFGGVFEQASNQLPIVGPAVWSESPASNTATAHSAEQYDSAKRQPIFRIDVEVDSWVSIGPNPDPSQSPRHLIRANGLPYDISVKPGDKLKWVAA